MKTEEENFDDLLKRKLQNETVPFKEKYWQNARTMLDQNRPQRKRYGFVLFMSALFFIAISAVLFNYHNNKTVLAPLAQKAPDSVTTSSAILSPAEHAGIITDVLSEVSPKAEASVLNTNTQADNNRINTNDDPGINSFRSITAAENSAIQTKQTGRKYAYEEAGTVEKQLTAMGSKEQDAAEEESDLNITGGDVVLNKEMLAVFVHPKWKTALETEEYKPESLRGSDRIRHRSVSYKMLEAGVNYYNPGSDMGANFNVHMGLKYCFSIAPRLSFATGVSYSRQHQNNGKRTYSAISYGFGENVQTTGINTIRLDYIEVPLSLFYNIKGRHGLMAGVSFNYLVQSSDLIKKANEISYKEKSAGYYAAFNRLDVQLHAGYTYTLNSRILLSAAYYGGITDVTKNSAFRSNEFNTNKGLRLTFGYQLY